MTAHPAPTPVPLAVLPRVRRRHYFPPAYIATRVCAKWGVTFEGVAGRGRTSQIAAARRDLARQLRSCTAMSLTEIGAFLGGRTHSAIFHLLKGGNCE